MSNLSRTSTRLLYFYLILQISAKNFQQREKMSDNTDVLKIKNKIYIRNTGKKESVSAYSINKSEVYA